MCVALIISLKERAAIKIKPVPVEPESIVTWRDMASKPHAYDVSATHKEIILYIDALQSALQVAQSAQAMLKSELGMAWTARDTERERAEQAESRNKRLVEALRVCRTALHETCHLPQSYDMNADPDGITLKTGRAFALADSLLVDDYAELLREADR